MFAIDGNVIIKLGSLVVIVIVLKIFLLSPK